MAKRPKHTHPPTTAQVTSQSPTPVRPDPKATALLYRELLFRELNTTVNGTLERLVVLHKGLVGETDPTSRGLRKQIGLARYAVRDLRRETGIANTRLHWLSDSLLSTEWARRRPRWVTDGKQQIGRLVRWLDAFDSVIEATIQCQGSIYTHLPEHLVPSLSEAEVYVSCTEAAAQVSELGEVLSSYRGDLDSLCAPQVFLSRARKPR